MLERFILWLVTKFVSKRSLTQYYVNTRFIKDPKGHIENLFHHAWSSADRPKDFPSLAQVMAHHLNKRFTLSELAYLHALATIKKDFIGCPDPSCNADTEMHTFLKKLAEVKEGTNHLKVRKELYSLVSKHLVMYESDKEMLVAILQNHYVAPDVDSSFIKHEI